jgi:hypothetical protein
VEDLGNTFGLVADGGSGGVDKARGSWAANAASGSALPCVRGVHFHHTCPPLPHQMATIGIPWNTPALPCLRSAHFQLMFATPTPNGHLWWSTPKYPGAPVGAWCSFSTYTSITPTPNQHCGGRPGWSWPVLAGPGWPWLVLAALGCHWLLLTAPGCMWLQQHHQQ